jgi:hypothetical protein
MTEELREAVCFAYAILGASTAEEAAAVWTANPEARRAAHAAFAKAWATDGALGRHATDEAKPNGPNKANGETQL